MVQTEQGTEFWNFHVQSLFRKPQIFYKIVRVKDKHR